MKQRSCSENNIHRIKTTVHLFRHMQDAYYTMISVILTFQVLIHLLSLYQFNLLFILQYKRLHFYLKPREFNPGNCLQMQSSVTKQKKVRHASLQQKKPVPISSGGKNESNRACPSGLGHSRKARAT